MKLIIQMFSRLIFIISFTLLSNSQIFSDCPLPRFKIPFPPSSSAYLPFITAAFPEANPVLVQTLTSQCFCPSSIIQPCAVPFVEQPDCSCGCGPANCPAPQIKNPQTCLCECPQIECPIGSIKNEKDCGCVCPNQPLNTFAFCGLQKRWENTSCSCVCRVTTIGGIAVDPRTCLPTSAVSQVANQLFNVFKVPIPQINLNAIAVPALPQ